MATGMSVLLPVFLAILLGETGSKTQNLARDFGRQGPHLPVLCALLLASAISYAIGAFGGLWIGKLLAEEARLLLAGLALALAGGPMLWIGKPAEAKPRPASVFAMMVRFMLSQFGDGAQFIVFAFAAYAMSPVLALSGGLLGVIAATWVMLSLDRMGIKTGAESATRIGAGIVLLFTGGWLAVTALKIG